MRYRFRDEQLSKLYKFDGPHTARFDPAIVKRFRERVKAIESAKDERDLHAIRSFRFKKLAGNRDHQYSLRLNDQWRLIVELEKDDSYTVVDIISVEDYH